MAESRIIIVIKNNNPLSSARWPKIAAAAAGLVVMALGFIIIISWHAHWLRLLQMFPEATPMQYNTAICFILCGAGLVPLNTRFAGISPWVGGMAGLLGLLTLLEYLGKWNFGIDQLFFKPYLQFAAAYPGRMAPLTAFCFVFFGTALGLTRSKETGRRRLTFAAMLACIIVSVGGVAVLGYLIGIETAYTWGAYTRMAFNTAGAFILIGIGLFIWCWQTAARRGFSFLHWVPIATSMTLIVMIAFISVATLFGLRNALGWRKHTYEVLLTAKSLENNLADIQRGLRGYVLSGQSEFLTPYAEGTNEAPRQLAHLIDLTRDNSVQQPRAQAFMPLLDAILVYANQVITLRHSEVSPPVTKPESLDVGEKMMNEADTNMLAFVQEEQRLLVERSAAVEKDFHNTALLLAFSSVLAAIFFIGGSLLVRHETRRRHRLELELAQATEKVKTLSGLLPICGSCKCIRDDGGYWNRIETYISQHTEAEFTHGICPECAIKQLEDAGVPVPDAMRAKVGQRRQH